jgi:hypothetical protein
MTWRVNLFFLVLLLTVIVPEAWGTIYKWVDENGIVHFSDDLKNIPEEYRGRVEKPISSEKAKEPSKKPSVLFEQKTDQNGNSKQWWQRLFRKWEEKKRDAENRMEELEIEIRQLDFNRRILGNVAKERARLNRLMQAARLRKDVANRMLTEGLLDEARRAGAPLEWLSNNTP